METGSQEQETFSEAVLGKGFFEQPWLRRWMRVRADWRIASVAAAFASLLFIPYLGAVGLWDPWETHYGEVARSMIARNDYLRPYWENAWFFSKPPFTMWMQALGMQLVGTNRTDGALARFTEWGFRMPFALFMVLATSLLSLALARLVNRRTALAFAFIFPTMPLVFLISRQAVTDTPFVASLVCALACALIGQLDANTRHRALWWYGFYAFCAVGTLAKGLLGVGLPAVVLVLYAALSVIPWSEQSLEAHLKWLWQNGFWPLMAGAGTAAAVAGAGVGLGWLEPNAVDLTMPAAVGFVAGATFMLRRPPEDGAQVPALWAQCYRMRLGTGVLLFFALAVPWYQAMFTFKGVDDESKLFWYRFLIHDHLNRLGAGVHTTTPGGTFTYFIEQGGYGIFPWVALVPGALLVASRLRLRSSEPGDHVGIVAVLWLVVSYGLIGASATKFHHYVLPMLPPIAMLAARFVDRLWEEGISAHAVPLLLGAPLFALVGKDLAGNPKNFTDLFVYNYDRPYPVELVTSAMGTLFGRALWSGDVLAAAFLGVGGYLALDAFSRKDRSWLSRAIALGFSLAGVALLVTVVMNGLRSLSPSLFVGLAVVLVALYLAGRAAAQTSERATLVVVAAGVGLVGLALVSRGLANGPDPLAAALTEPLTVKSGLGFAFVFAGVLCAVAALSRARLMLFGSFWALACAFALWFNWSHWVDLSHHWTQRDLFWRYYAQRKPNEPIAAFLMNWRGETFYSRNQVKQVKDNALMGQYAAQPGREWALVEHNRLGLLRAAVGSDKTVSLVDRDLNNKFILVTID